MVTIRRMASIASTNHQKTSQRVVLSVRLEPKLHDRIRQEAAARDVSVNWLIARACERFLQRKVKAGAA